MAGAGVLLEEVEKKEGDIAVCILQVCRERSCAKGYKGGWGCCYPSFCSVALVPYARLQKGWVDLCHTSVLLCSAVTSTFRTLELMAAPFICPATDIEDRHMCRALGRCRFIMCLAWDMTMIIRVGL
jgi:hypothetical protein